MATKILPLNKYKLTDNGFRVVLVSPRRLFILLTFVLSVVASAVLVNVDRLFPYNIIEHIYVPAKSSTQLKIESFIKTKGVELTDETIEQYATLIVRYARENDISPYLLAGQIYKESTFNRYAISDSNALGLTQVIPKWHKEKIATLRKRFGKFDIFNPEHNIALGTMVLTEYIQQSNGNRTNALLRYSGQLGSPDPVYAKDVLRAKKMVEEWGA